MDQVEAVLEKDPEIKIITFAHVLGNPPDMDRVMSLVQKYDLIFSNQVIQYFKPQMLISFIENMKKMMHNKSLLVCAGVPNKKLRFKYNIGEVTQWHDISPGKSNYSRGLAKYLLRLYRDPMGYWYSFNDIRKICDRQKLNVKFLGSMHFFYRFHFIIRL